MTKPLNVVCVVVFGAPATGKTTLLRMLEAATEGTVHYATIDEPTHYPDIAQKLAIMYNESQETIAAGKSVAFDVQMRIMTRRAQIYAEFYHGLLQLHVELAAKKGCHTVAVVCDGHLLTDDKLYVQSKVDSGQISLDQQHSYEVIKEAYLKTLPPLFATPDEFLELTLADASGHTHIRRIAARESFVEVGVPAAVFARLSQYASRASDQLTRDLGATTAISTMLTDTFTPLEMLQKFKHFVEQRVSSHLKNFRHPKNLDLDVMAAKLLTSIRTSEAIVI